MGVFVRVVGRDSIRGVRGIGGCILRWRGVVVVNGGSEENESELALWETSLGLSMRGDQFSWDLVFQGHRTKSRGKRKGREMSQELEGRPLHCL